MKKQTLILLWIAGVASAASPAPSGRSRPALFKDSRQTLAIARAQGRKEVSILLAAKPGAAASVAKEAARLGGDVRYRDDEIGYLRVKVPIDQAHEARRIRGSPGRLARLRRQLPQPARGRPRRAPAAGPRTVRRRRGRRRSPSTRSSIRTRRSRTWPPPISSRSIRPGTGAASRSGCSTATSTCSCRNSRRPIRSTGRRSRSSPTT